MKHMCFLFWLFSWILILAPQALANSMGSKTVLIDCQNGLPPGGYQIEVSDPYDNRSPKYNAYLGQAFDYVDSPVGGDLRRSPISSDSSFTIVVRSKLPAGAIRVNFYYKGELRAFSSRRAPGQRAVFAPKCNSVK